MHAIDFGAVVPGLRRHRRSDHLEPDLVVAEARFGARKRKPQWTSWSHTRLLEQRVALRALSRTSRRTAMNRERPFLQSLAQLAGGPQQLNVGPVHQCTPRSYEPNYSVANWRGPPGVAPDRIQSKHLLSDGSIALLRFGPVERT